MYLRPSWGLVDGGLLHHLRRGLAAVRVVGDAPDEGLHAHDQGLEQLFAVSKLLGMFRGALQRADQAGKLK